MKALNIFLVALLVITPSIAQPVVWTQAADALSPFYRAGSGVLGNYLYCFGSTFNDIPSAQAYNLTTESWAQSTLPLVGVAGYASVTTDTAIYLIGGWRNNPRLYYNEVQKFVPDGAGPTGTWTLMREYPLEACGMAAAWDGGNYIYCVGGSLDDIVWLPTAYKYDIAGNSWSPIADAPNAVGVAGAAFLNGKFYFAGGWAPNTYDDLLEYDPASDTWASRTSPPVPIAFSGYGTTDNGSLMFVISGGGDTPQSPLTNAVLTYNPLTDVWAQETPLPTEYNHIGGATARFVPPDKVIVAGGVWNTDWQCVTTTYRGEGFPSGLFEGGETCETATVIPGIPYTGEGNTNDNVDDHNPPFAFPGGRDVVYRYAPSTDQCVDISLCGSSYDTRLLVYHGACSGNPFRINDDGQCPSVPSPFTSLLQGVNLLAGENYYIVVDGYDGTSHGSYDLQIAACGPPWVPDEPCPGNTLFGQPHINESYALISDSTWPWNDICLYDNFTGLSQAICAVDFWGVTITSNQQPCTEDPMAFQIAFHAESEGLPGAVVASYPFNLSREEAGVYNGYPVWKYTAELNPCVTLADGWISIQAVAVDDQCYFGWSHSLIGDGVDWQYVNGVPSYRTYTDHAFCLLAAPSAASEQSTLPTQYALHQNYPNPFNPSTTIAFDLPKASYISLRVFDLLGREVELLKEGFVEAGSHNVVFDGAGLATGMYFARLDAGKFSQTKKLMLLK